MKTPKIQESLCYQKLVLLKYITSTFLIDRCKSWKTYTLSYYEDLLRELIKLAIMKTKNQDKHCCALFLRGINRMCQNFINKADGTTCLTYSFNSREMKSDEHPGNRIAIEKVFGKGFLENRTSSCSYHFDKSVARHKVYIKKEDIQIYMKLTSNLKNCVTVEEYQRTKEQYESLINRQLEGDRRPLISTFKFWDNLKYRWATAYKSNLHAIPNASLAEAAQASMKASNEKNISLVDSIYADISDSARLDAKWKNRLLGEHSVEGDHRH